MEDNLGWKTTFRGRRPAVYRGSLYAAAFLFDIRNAQEKQLKNCSSNENPVGEAKPSPRQPHLVSDALKDLLLL